MKAIRDLIARHKAGERVGITSVCSAHPLVIEATLRHALAHGAPLALIEATSNQVNQDGGYTGMKPADYRDFVVGDRRPRRLPARPRRAGRRSPRPQRLDRAARRRGDGQGRGDGRRLCRAGFGKIHLDCSMSCADDPVPLPEHTIAERAARLCKAAEAAYCGRSCGRAESTSSAPKCPCPAARRRISTSSRSPRPKPRSRRSTCTATCSPSRGLASAWDRVIATVVQPGVEFDHDKVVDYVPEKATALSAAIEPVDHIVFEAHSTDYQTPAALAALVRDHFAILKVGPGVTFALREALVGARRDRARDCCRRATRANLRDVTIARMHAEPANWSQILSWRKATRSISSCNYSLSDRIRYYWPDAEIAAAQDKLFANLRAHVAAAAAGQPISAHRLCRRPRRPRLARPRRSGDRPYRRDARRLSRSLPPQCLIPLSVAPASADQRRALDAA